MLIQSIGYLCSTPNQQKENSMLCTPKCILWGGSKRRCTSPLNWSCWWRWKGVGIVFCNRYHQQCAVWSIRWFHNLQDIIFLPILNQFLMLQLWLPKGQKTEPIMGRAFVRSSPPPAENADHNSEMLFFSANFSKCILIGAIALQCSFQAGGSCQTEEIHCCILHYHVAHFGMTLLIQFNVRCKWP